ncbi:MAG TPA: hypothetical protein VLS88_19755 [Polyangiales bacterium]|nr:hypothetical protein [Polyangiales bacterium]
MNTAGVSLLAVVFLFTLTHPAERTIAQETKRMAAIRMLDFFMIRFRFLKVIATPSVTLLS